MSRKVTARDPEAEAARRRAKEAARTARRAEAQKVREQSRARMAKPAPLGFSSRAIRRHQWSFDP